MVETKFAKHLHRDSNVFSDYNLKRVIYHSHVHVSYVRIRNIALTILTNFNYVVQPIFSITFYKSNLLVQSNYQLINYFKRYNFQIHFDQYLEYLHRNVCMSVL